MTDFATSKRAIKLKGFGLRLPRGSKVCFYAIRCQEYVKVGLTNDLDRRLAVMQTGNPYPLFCETFRSVPVEFAATIEHMTHLNLAGCHHHGEWFICDKTTVREAFTKALSDLRKEQSRERLLEKVLKAAISVERNPNQYIGMAGTPIEDQVCRKRAVATNKSKDRRYACNR